MDSPIMLELEAVDIAYAAEAVIFTGVGLNVKRGECLLVTGAAGCGKTTLLNVAAGIVPKILRPRNFAGTVRIDGIDMSALPAAELYRRVGVVLQSVEEQIWDFAVEDLVAFPLENRAMQPAEVRERVLSLAGELGISHLFGRRVRTLSGGERRIVALASALVFDPQILVLDEPATGLDPDARRRMIDILRGLRAKGLTMLIAEQDLIWFKGVADEVLFMDSNRVVMKMLPWSEAVGAAQAADPDLPRHPEGVDCGNQSSDVEFVKRPVLSARGMSSELSRPDGTPVLSSINIDLMSGATYALIGRNGAGKSTLVQMLIGVQNAAAGSVLLEGKDTEDWTVAQRARHIGYIAQNAGRMFFLLTVLDEIVFSLSGGETGLKAIRQFGKAAIRLLESFHLGEKAQASPFALSMREQLMLALACTEASGPSVVVLDEPLIAHDAIWRDDLLRYLNRCRALGRAVLIITHDLGLAATAADRLFILDAGMITFDGPIERGWLSPAFHRLGWEPPAPLTREMEKDRRVPI